MDKDKNLLDTFFEMDLSQAERLALLRAVFLKDSSSEPAGCGPLKAALDDLSTFPAQKTLFLTGVIDWMLSLEEVPDQEFERYCELGEFIGLEADEKGAWVAFELLLAQFLIEQGRVDEAVPRVAELERLLPEDENIGYMAKACRTNLIEKGAATRTAETKGVHMMTGCDKEFYAMIDQLKTCSLEQLLSNAATKANEWLETNHEYYGLLLKTYRGWYGVRLFGQDQGFINYFGGMYQYWKQNADKLVWLYEELADYRSKMTLKIMLQHWLTFHPDLRRMGREAQFEHYFDYDVIRCGRDEVFVDCGCFDGNTVKDFIRCYGDEYKHIYSYELTPSTYEVAKENLKDIPRLSLRNAGVSDQNGQFPFRDSGYSSGMAGANRLSEQGNAIARVVRIDDDIPEPVTFIKMDIEGAECAALRGAERQIRNNKPKLAISLYHSLPDLIEIPKIVKSIVPEYKLYLRQFIEAGNEEFPFPIEYVLLAVAE